MTTSRHATVTQVDPHDEDALRAWYAAFRSGCVADRPAGIVLAYPEIAYPLRNPTDNAQRDAFAAYADGSVVGALLLECSLRENTHLVDVTLGVPPEHRGAGYGSALLERATEYAAANGRSTLGGEIDVAEGYGDDWPGVRFAERHGFAHLHTEYHLVLDLPVPEGLLDELAAHAEPRHTDYRFFSWLGPCPEEHLEAFASMHTTMGQDVPVGELDYEPTVWDADRIRESQQRSAARGFTSLTTVAMAPDGEYTGYSELVVPEHQPGHVLQEDTLVLRAHRGRRIGTGLKVRNLRLLAEHHPDSRLVHTWTSDSNGPMQHVNTSFGFRRAETMREYQLVL